MSEIEIQKHIIQVVGKLSYVQQVKLLEFIKAFFPTSSGVAAQNLLSFAGVFDEQDAQEFAASLKDCSQIDHDDW